jgi:hypothetical protein
MIDEKQEAIATAIAARTVIAAGITAGRIRVASAVKGQLASDIAAALGKLKMLFVVEAVESKVGYSLDKPVLQTSINIAVFENVLTNRKGTNGTDYITAGRGVEEVCFALKPSAGLQVIVENIALEDSLTKLLTYNIACQGRMTLTEVVTP